jgi:excisionase family DNA binding protein
MPEIALPEADERLAYSPQEVADKLGVSRAMVYAQVSSGELRSIKFGGRRLIPASVLREILAAV